MLELTAVEAGYRDLTVLHGIDLEVRAGDENCILLVGRFHLAIDDVALGVAIIEALEWFRALPVAEEIGHQLFDLCPLTAISPAAGAKKSL